jgi:hypothetical protein
MNKSTLIASFVLILAMLACNMPSVGSTQMAETIITETATLALASDTPNPTLTSLPTDTPFPTLIPTPTIPVASPIDQNVNCRLGPGTEWSVIGSLLLGQTAAIQGKNENASWWYITAPDSGKACWLAASVIFTSGNLASLPVIPAPVASVTDVSVNLNPKDISLLTCLQPITIKGTIETNGPTKVKYYFKTEQGGDQPIEEINFKVADKKTVETSYTPPVPSSGTYWVRLIIVSPGDKVGEAKYKVQCP